MYLIKPQFFFFSKIGIVGNCERFSIGPTWEVGGQLGGSGCKIDQ